MALHSWRHWFKRMVKAGQTEKTSSRRKPRLPLQVEYLEDRLSPAGLFNVMSYGAVGNGIADDTKAINQAITAAIDASGGTVYLPQGTYKITNNLSLYDANGVTICGAGMGATVILGYGQYPGQNYGGITLAASLCVVASSNCMVEDLTVNQATNSVKGANAIEFFPNGGGTPCKSCTVKQCEILGDPAQEYGIWDRDGQGISILDNYIDGGVTSSSTIWQEGIEADGDCNALIQGNTILDCGYGAINVYPPSSKAALAGEEINGVQVLDNYISTCQAGIDICGGLDTPPLSQNPCPTIVSGNTVLNTFYRGIESTVPGGAAMESLQISDNIVKTCNEGITIWGNPGSTFTGCQVTANLVEWASSPTEGGIVVSGANNVQVDNNTVEDSTNNGMRCMLASGVEFLNNSVENTQKQGLDIISSSDITVTGNWFNDYNLANASGAGVLVYGTTSSGVVVTENGFATTEDYWAVDIQQGNQCQAANNQLLYSSQLPAVFRDLATNANFGKATIAPNTTSVTINDTLVSSGSTPVVTQTGTNPVPFTVSSVPGQSFTIAIAAVTSSPIPFQWNIPLAAQAVDTTVGCGTLTELTPDTPPASVPGASLIVAASGSQESVFNVKNYGAAGDGTTNDTTAINNAIAAAIAAGGGIVYLPAGTYKITNNLSVYHATGVTIIGAGEGETVIRGYGPYAGINYGGISLAASICVVASSGCMVENLTVDLRTGDVTNANGIEFAPDGSGTVCSSCTVQQCEVLGVECASVPHLESPGAAHQYPEQPCGWGRNLF